MHEITYINLYAFQQTDYPNNGYDGGLHAFWELLNVHCPSRWNDTVIWGENVVTYTMHKNKNLFVLPKLYFFPGKVTFSTFSGKTKD